MKLITLDRSKNVTYFGDCKLLFQGIEKCLNVTLLDKVPEEIMKANFQSVFVRRNNLLCCMNQNFNNVMIIVFPTKEKCKLIYDAVIKEKLRQSQSISAPAIDENEIFKDCFYLPLVKAAKNGYAGLMGLKTIFAEFVESLDTDEVNYYFNNMTETPWGQTPISTEMEETFVRQKRIVKPMHLTPAPETSSFHSTRTTFGGSLPTNMHKRSISHKEDDEKENKIVGTSRKKLKVTRKPSPKASNVSCLTVAIVKPMHLTPAPETSSFHSSRTTFGISLPTNMHRPSISCKEDKASNVSCLAEASSSTPNVFVIDEPSPQNTPENVDFDIVEYLQDRKIDKKLLVFTSNERKKCYEYMFVQKTCNFRCIKCLEQKIHIVLKTTLNHGCRNFDFDTVEHVCESIEYLPENYGSSLIIKAPNFKLLNGKNSPSLIIFSSCDKSLYYKFGYDIRRKLYHCNQCVQQTARFIQHGGENAIELNRLNHFCEPKKIVGTSRKKLKVSRKASREASNVSTVASSSAPNVFVIDEPSPQNTPENVDFDIVEYLQDGKLDKKLLVFTSNERKKCYEYMFVRNSCVLRCIQCLEQKKEIILKTTKTPGCRNFDFNTDEHVCESIGYLPENYGSSLIIKAPNFKLLNEKNPPSLIIFNSGDKNLCYKFGYDNSQKVYYCNQCITQNMKLTARFIQHGGENAIELNRLDHICQPKKCIL